MGDGVGIQDHSAASDGGGPVENFLRAAIITLSIE